ncbi:hypothetical protein BDW02DRAFT_567243 [Decorospora gaudefroyi]|uniref:Rhodopsin domain-containing protein n=1 Tax=Decorospora gaudefroyi TaxID=184978 RepID=A0A6A5KKG9_9PLEO|nr:hypothetical protein BDW02DRAFT_567243 [Decorospora gaudefroyi]
MKSSGTMPPDESRAQVLITTVIAFLVMDYTFVALRFWSRRIQRTKLRSDDLFVIAGLLLITGTCGISIWAVKHGGVGRHLQYVSKPERVRWLKSVYIAAPSVYIVSASFPKLAVVSIYLQIFNPGPSRICCWIIAIALAVGPVIQVPICVWQCVPVAYLWDKSIPGGHCLQQAHMFRYGSLPNIVTDVAILVLPMPLIWKLHTSTRVKIGLLITFLLGSIGLVTSILRFVAFFTPIVDGTWAAVPLLCWVIIEPSIYLLAACLLTFKPLLRYVAQESSLSRRIRSWSSARSGRHRDSLYGQGPGGGGTRLPSDDGKSDNKILREREFCVERTVDSSEAFGMSSVFSSRS